MIKQNEKTQKTTPKQAIRARTKNLLQFSICQMNSQICISHFATYFARYYFVFELVLVCYASKTSFGPQTGQSVQVSV